MNLRIDDSKQRLYGDETITFYNNSPDALNYLWMELTQNVRALDSDSYKIQSTGDLSAQRGNEKMVIGNTISSRTLENFYRDFDGGFKIMYVKDEKNKKYAFAFSRFITSLYPLLEKENNNPDSGKIPHFEKVIVFLLLIKIYLYHHK